MEPLHTGWCHLSLHQELITEGTCREDRPGILTKVQVARGDRQCPDCQQRMLLQTKCECWGTGSEEWAVLSVIVTELPFLTADTALSWALLCP